jgi:hypothetical protein
LFKRHAANPEDMKDLDLTTELTQLVRTFHKQKDSDVMCFENEQNLGETNDFPRRKLIITQVKFPFNAKINTLQTIDQCNRSNLPYIFPAKSPQIV